MDNKQWNSKLICDDLSAGTKASLFVWTTELAIFASKSSRREFGPYESYDQSDEFKPVWIFRTSPCDLVPQNASRELFVGQVLVTSPFVQTLKLQGKVVGTSSLVCADLKELRMMSVKGKVEHTLGLEENDWPCRTLEPISNRSVSGTLPFWSKGNQTFYNFLSSWNKFALFQKLIRLVVLETENRMKHRVSTSCWLALAKRTRHTTSTLMLGPLGGGATSRNFLGDKNAFFSNFSTNTPSIMTCPPPLSLARTPFYSAKNFASYWRRE